MLPHSNMGMTRNDYLQEEIEEAARLSNAHAFIMALPRGYSTVVCLPADPTFIQP